MYLEKKKVAIIIMHRLYVHLGRPPRTKRGAASSPALLPNLGCRGRQLKRKQKRAANGGKTPNDTKHRHTHKKKIPTDTKTPTNTEHQPKRNAN